MRPFDDNEKQKKGKSIARLTTTEKSEGEYDLATYECAMAEYKKNPVTYSHE